jgi:hypothetical protein
VQRKNLSHRAIENLKDWVDQWGVGGWLRQVIVEARLIGERAKFVVTHRPEPANAIVLAGSGRSGTTWIGNVLCALKGVQPIFEPLFPPWNETVREITGWDTSNPYFRAVYLRDRGNYREWRQLWYQILTGRHRNYWTDYQRETYFPNRFLIKEVRANMMLAYLYQQFKPRIVYVLRHPCAVIYSRLVAQQPWHADVRDLLSQEELVVDYLTPWIAEIEKEKDLVGTHAVWWAVENLVALQQLANIPHYFVHFEELVLNPKEILQPLIAWLGYEKLPPKVMKILSQPSRMSNRNLVYRDTRDRLSYWQHHLSIEDQRRIITWADRVGLSRYAEQHVQSI